MTNDKYDVNDIAKFLTEDPDIFAEPTENTDKKATGSAGPATAPVKPSTQPNTTPRERPQPTKTPWKNPAPDVKPKPKAFKRTVINEAYRDFTHPRTQEMWEKGHPGVSFTDHEMVKKYGSKLAEQGYNDSNSTLFKTFPELKDLPPDRRRQQLGQLTGRALQKMMSLEQPFKKQLEKIAVKAVAKLYGCPEETLKAFLRQPQPEQDDNDEENERGDEKVEMTAELQDQVSKRHMMNLLSQGSAIHNMHNGHFEEEVMDAVGRLSPELQQLYSAFGRGASHHYWIYDLNAMLGASIGQAMGTAKVKGDTVQAEAACFPVLLQELVKGLMTLLAQHQFTDVDKKVSKEVVRLADTLANEFPQIQIGPKIWKELLSIIPAEHKSKLAHVVMHMASAHPKELHVIMMGLADNMAEGRPSKGTTTEQALVELLERSMREEDSDENEAGYQEDYNDGDDEESNDDDHHSGDDDEEEGQESWR